MPVDRSGSRCDPDSAKGYAALRPSLPSSGEDQERHISVQAIDQREEFLWIADEPAKPDAFPPCIRGILSGPVQTGQATDDKEAIVEAAAEAGKSAVCAETGGGDSREKEKKGEKGQRGKYRAAAILAAFLGQAGFSREHAMQIWSQASDVEVRIFEKWFRKMHCPKCRVMQRQSRGYPDLGVADLGLCQPDEVCQKFVGPVEHACRIFLEEDQKRGKLSHIKTICVLRFFDWSTGQEKEIELSQKEKEKLEALLSEKAELKDKIIVYARKRVRGRLRPAFYLRDQEEPRRQVLSDLM